MKTMVPFTSSRSIKDKAVSTTSTSIVARNIRNYKDNGELSEIVDLKKGY